MATTIKEYLSSVKDKQDRNLHTHLSNVLSRILLDNPKNSFDIFEDYSHNVKQQNFDFDKNDNFDENCQRLRETNGELKNYVEKAKKLLEKLTDGGEEPVEVGAIGYVPNFMEEAKWFEQCGVGFGAEESYRIFKSLSVLSCRKQAKQVRLWGKILGSQKDYWVAEGIIENSEEGDLPANVEPKGSKGVNKLNYWVVNELNEDWVELPYVTPEQIIVSRRIKKVFTGKLETDIIVNPHFEGKEKHLLKCQIVRMTACNSVIPAGLFQVNADDAREIEPPEEEKKFPDFEFLSKLNNWVHNSENILQEGRVTHMKPENLPEDVDEEKFMADKVAQDPFDPRLKQLSSDRAPEGYKNAWTLKTYGDQTNYALAQKEAGFCNYGFIAIKNLYWPGYVTVYHKQQWQSLYIGQGFKASNNLYYPQEPEIILEEQADLVGQNEPNFPAEVKQEQKQDQKEEEEEG